MGLLHRKKEEKLENKGNIYVLQKHRLKKALSGFYRDFDERLPKFLQTEQRLREVVQRELALAEEIEKDSTPARMQEIREEIQYLKQNYFFADREWHQILSTFANPTLLRGFHFWRSDPQWYLHKTLVQICAEHGGCCARNCGCCQTRDLGSNRRLGVGHCTLECRCCQNDIDCTLIHGATQDMKNLSLPDRNRNYRHYRTLMLASVFGLADYSTANPFDLIERPPRYETIL